MGRIVHLIFVEGSAEKRARQYWHAAGHSPNAEATLLVWLSTLMGDCQGKSPCCKNFLHESKRSGPYAGFAGFGPASLMLFASAIKRSCLTCNVVFRAGAFASVTSK